MEQLSDLKMMFHFVGEELTICYADPLLPAKIRCGKKFYLGEEKEKKYNFLIRQNPRKYKFFSGKRYSGTSTSPANVPDVRCVKL